MLHPPSCSLVRRTLEQRCSQGAISKAVLEVLGKFLDWCTHMRVIYISAHSFEFEHSRWIGFMIDLGRNLRQGAC